VGDREFQYEIVRAHVISILEEGPPATSMIQDSVHSCRSMADR